MVYVAFGGALGALARYGLGGWIQARTGFAFPWGTLAVNVLGSFLLGLGLRYLEGVPAAPEFRALVSIGLLGAFTTFSTFSYETVTLLEEGEWTGAGLYAAGSLMLSLGAVYVGLGIAELALRTAR